MLNQRIADHFDALMGNVSAEQLPIRFYSTTDGLGISGVNKLLFDTRVFLWSAIGNGLSRFDGFRFINYKLGRGTTADNGIQIIERPVTRPASSRFQ